MLGNMTFQNTLARYTKFIIDCVIIYSAISQTHKNRNSILLHLRYYYISIWCMHIEL